MKLVEKIEIIDDYNFRIHFSTPDVTFIPYRGGGMIASKSYYDKVGEDKFVKQPVGTGPYKVTNYVPGEYVDLERFEEYWGPKPSVKEARFFFVPEDTTRVAKLKAGEVDFIGACPYPSVNDLEKTPGIKVIRLATGHPTPSIIFQNKNPKTPWYDRRVRMAMAHAIDCDAIIKNILMGYPERYARLAPWELGYDPELKPYPYDPKKAKELLAQAGYPNGFELNLYWAMTGRTPMTREMTEAIASYLQAVGIRVKLVGEENATHYARQRSMKKNPEGQYVSFNSVGFVAGAVEATFILDIILTTDGGFSVYSNPEFDKVVAEARGTVNNAERAKIIKKAVQIAYDEVPNIPICNIVFFYAMKNNIDFVPTQKFSFDVIMVRDVTVK
jgi:peptide/nickel transport system substrate-binding protein